MRQWTLTKCIGVIISQYMEVQALCCTSQMYTMLYVSNALVQLEKVKPMAQQSHNMAPRVLRPEPALQ